MACRALIRQNRGLALAAAGKRRRSTAAIAEEAAECPFRYKPQVDDSVSTDLKPYKAIPTAKGLPLIGTTLDIVRHGGAAKMHEYVDMRHRQLGPIFRERLGPVEAVVVGEKDLISSVYSSEEQYPMHMVPDPWLIYNQMKGIERGLFFMDGQQWQEKRKILNQSLLSPQEVAKYGRYVGGIVQDLIKRWATLTENHQGVLPNLETELYNWSIETLGTIVFGRRLGCVTQPGEANSMHSFVHNVQKIFAESANMSLFSPKLAATLRLPVWRRFEEAADNAIRIARECTEQRIAELQSVSDLREHGVIGRLLSHENVSQDQIVSIVADLIIAAADTTSHATQWALYSLAKNPVCQEELAKQINQVVPSGATITEEHIDKIPYLLWVVKETLRLYPIAPFLTRKFRKNIPLAGFEIPARTLVLMSQYTMGRNPNSFSQPNDFVPERWQRTGKGLHQNLSHGCMPFGTGARSCIGKRVAELKMRMLIARTVQKYRLEAQNDVGIAMRMITTPDKPILINFQKRDQ